MVSDVNKAHGQGWNVICSYYSYYNLETAVKQITQGLYLSWDFQHTVNSSANILRLTCT